MDDFDQHVASIGRTRAITFFIKQAIAVAFLVWLVHQLWKTFS